MEDKAKEEVKQLDEDQEALELTSEDLEQVAGGDTELDEEARRLATKMRRPENRRKALEQFADIVRRDNHLSTSNFYKF